MFRISLALIALISISQASYAGECTLHIAREACAGKDSESYKKCDGKKECDEAKKAADAVACAKMAEAECANVGARQKITKSKTIKAQFDGSAIEGGKNFCAADRPDFNKCGN